MSFVTDCASCGKQVLIDGPGEKCYWCGESASSQLFTRIATKEDITMQENTVGARPRKKTQLWQYFERQKDAMIADYESMKLGDFFSKWRISSGTWGRLKKAWNISGKKERIVAVSQVPIIDPGETEKAKVQIVADCLEAHRLDHHRDIATRVIALVRLLDKWHSEYTKSN